MLNFLENVLYLLIICCLHIYIVDNIGGIYTESIFFLGSVTVFFIWRNGMKFSHYRFSAKNKKSYYKKYEELLERMKDFNFSSVNPTWLLFAHSIDRETLKYNVKRCVEEIEYSQIPSNVIIALSPLSEGGANEERELLPILNKSSYVISYCFTQEEPTENDVTKAKKLAWVKGLTIYSKNILAVNRLKRIRSPLIFLDADGNPVHKNGIGFLKETIMWLSVFDVGGVTFKNKPQVENGTAYQKSIYRVRTELRRTIYGLSIGRKGFDGDPDITIGGGNVTTGRGSAVEEEIAEELLQAFLDDVQRDIKVFGLIDRYVRRLTGDDKLPFYLIMKQKKHLVFCHNLTTNNIEVIPTPPKDAPFYEKIWTYQFLRNIHRFSMNMLANRRRLLALGPEVLGRWRYITVADGGVSGWTTFIGLITAIMLGITYSHVNFLLYVEALMIMAMIDNKIMSKITDVKTFPIDNLVLPESRFMEAYGKIKGNFYQNISEWPRHGISIFGKKVGNRVIWLSCVTIFIVLLAIRVDILGVPDDIHFFN